MTIQMGYFWANIDLVIFSLDILSKEALKQLVMCFCSAHLCEMKERKSGWVHHASQGSVLSILVVVCRVVNLDNPLSISIATIKLWSPQQLI